MCLLCPPGSVLSARDVSQLLFSRSSCLEGERETNRHFGNQCEPGGHGKAEKRFLSRPAADV